MAISNLINPPDGQHMRYHSIISCITRLASYMKQSPQRREKFIGTVNLLYDGSQPTNATTLLTPVSTRWNSTYDKLKRALTLKDACKQYSLPESMEAYQLTTHKWEKLSTIVKFLQPLYEATMIICGSSDPTINQALPLYILLIKRIEQACAQYDVAPLGPEASAMTLRLTKYLKQLLIKNPVICATILDPLCKLKFLSTHEEILAKFGTSSLKLAVIFEEDARSHFTLSSSQTMDSVNHNISTGLFEEMYPLSLPKGNTVEIEVQRYLAEPPEPKETDILIFWKSRGTVFPTLANMACKYLAIAATSAPSERVFSSGRKIVTYQSSTLSSMHVEQLAFVKDWGRIFGPIYSLD
ncbi:hypothetical protein O181_002415 [Austropuccinia psidii MF-1]|uniref:HAT C-terminal dimerisation domain-containing protein n=1 Tax=Austropuccinia psidii MF-1 TaxID=1389203 RepID=A0A9Q3GCU0_9BASI|nr:hypothetical protein [Austropuccinia psidii MF-1]